MKKTICSILALFILTQLNCYSQEITRTSIKIDRIKQILERTESDTVRILQLQNWSDIIFYSNPDLHLKLQTDIVGLCEDNLLNPSSEKEKKWFEEQIWIAFDHIGSIYFYDYDEPVKALKFYLKSAEVLETLDHLNSSSITYDIIGNIYQQLGNYQKANGYFQKRIKIDQSISKKFEEKLLLDSIQLVNRNKEIAFQKETAAKEEKLKREAERLNTILEIGIVLFLLSFVIVYVQWRKSKKQNKIIEEQHKQLDENHKEITDSISYAKNIQDAMMTSTVYLKDVLPESFIFFKPKDVVSGDYYWVYKTPYNNIYFTVADCTGHGVPGAFMSMIGTSLLNENIIEKKVNNPGEILDNMRDKIIASLNNKDSKKETRDGMDVALCKINFEKLTLQYAGANNPLVHVRNGEINHIKANYQPVALTVGEKKPFINHDIKLEKGDMIYIFSDGYADQFGGPKGKKYMTTKFRKYLASISHHSMEEQHEMLEREFQQWKGDHDQIDDVCIMGVRV